MTLDRLSLTTFRNHGETRIDGAQFNLLVGENGAGKTNVLEAISLLSPGRDLPGGPARHGRQGRCWRLFDRAADLAASAGPVRLGTGTQPDRPTRRIVQVEGADVAANSLSEWLSIGWRPQRWIACLPEEALRAAALS